MSPKPIPPPDYSSTGGKRNPPIFEVTNGTKKPPTLVTSGGVDKAPLLEKSAVGLGQQKPAGNVPEEYTNEVTIDLVPIGLALLIVAGLTYWFRKKK